MRGQRVSVLDIRRDCSVGILDWVWLVSEQLEKFMLSGGSVTTVMSRRKSETTY